MKKTLWISVAALALCSACVVRTYEGPGPVVVAGSEPIYWYMGYHLLPGGGYCYMEGRHWHDYAPDMVYEANYVWEPAGYYVFRPSATVYIPPPPPGYHGAIAANGVRVESRGGFNAPPGRPVAPPPGHSGMAPGHGYNEPPGHGGVPPGQVNNPGHGGVVEPVGYNPPPGHGGVPPGQGGTPPGQQAGGYNPPPGHGGVPPGQGGTPPGHNAGGPPPGQINNPGHGGTPPGQSGAPPGQQKKKK